MSDRGRKRVREEQQQQLEDSNAEGGSKGGSPARKKLPRNAKNSPGSGVASIPAKSSGGSSGRKGGSKKRSPGASKKQKEMEDNHGSLVYTRYFERLAMNKMSEFTNDLVAPCTGQRIEGTYLNRSNAAFKVFRGLVIEKKLDGWESYYEEEWKTLSSLRGANRIKYIEHLRKQEKEHPEEWRKSVLRKYCILFC